MEATFLWQDSAGESERVDEGEILVGWTQNSAASQALRSAQTSSNLVWAGGGWSNAPPTMGSRCRTPARTPGLGVVVMGNGQDSSSTAAQCLHHIHVKPQNWNWVKLQKNNVVSLAQPSLWTGIHFCHRVAVVMTFVILSLHSGNPLLYSSEGEITDMLRVFPAQSTTSSHYSRDRPTPLPFSINSGRTQSFAPSFHLLRLKVSCVGDHIRQQKYSREQTSSFSPEDCILKVRDTVNK